MDNILFTVDEALKFASKVGSEEWVSKNYISYNKNIFTVYVGLTAAGYDLAKTPGNKEIHDGIYRIHWAGDTINYFNKARINTCEVNPYWPRDYFLTLGSLYLTEEGGYTYTNFNEVTAIYFYKKYA